MDEIELYASGHSIPEVSKKTGIPMSTIRFKLKKLGILRTRQEGINLASKNGKLGGGNRGKKRTFTEKWKENISKGKIACGEINAKGVSLKPSGYMEITRGKNKGRLEHVVIIEKMIGRKLFANECVHHKDKNKSNNNIENLQLMTRSEHASHHAKENIASRNRDSNGRLK